MLVERDQETDRLTRLLFGGAREGSRLAVISGAVASGKTALLHQVTDTAGARGVRVLNAVASAFEQEFPYAVVEQLYQGMPAHLQHARPRPGLDTPHSPHGPHQADLPLLQAFHRALDELTADAPLLIAIDDVQYADLPSLRALAYGIRRCRSEALSVVMTRGALTGPAGPALDELLHRPNACHVRLAPLTVAGVTTLLTEELGPAEAERHAAAFHDLTGGNLLLLRGLLDDRFSRLTCGPLDTAPGTGTPAPGELFRQAALSCVYRGGPAHHRIAQGIALLGDGSSARRLSKLVAVEERQVRQAVAALTEVGILHEAQFRSADVRTVLLDDLPADELARLHHRAARLLHEEGADPIDVAGHLLHHELAEPVEEWIPETLRDAARHAVAADRMELAVNCLQMAHRCTTDERETLILQVTMVEAMWPFNPLSQLRRLQSLAGPASNGQLPAEYAIPVLLRLLTLGQTAEAAAALGRIGRDASPGSELDTTLRTIDLALASTFPGSPELRTFVERAEPDGPRAGGPLTAEQTPESPQLTAGKALRTVLRHGADDRAVQAAERVLETTRLTDPTMPTVHAALQVLIYADRLATATTWCDQLIEQCERRGAKGVLAAFRALRAQIALRAGRLPDAVRYAERALEELPARGWGVAVGVPLAVLINAHTAMGHHDTAAEILARPVPEEMFRSRYGLHYLYARACHQLATGRQHAALTGFRACGEKMTAWGLDSPAMLPWRLGAAETWLTLGSQDRAARLAQEQLELTGEAPSRTRGAALRVLAATRPASERPALLQQAVAVLQETGGWYEMARALADLAEAHKQLGDLDTSRLMTRRALRLADGCGAEELSRSLQRTPGRSALSEAARTGEETTTFSELSDAESRVAALAASGYTNREIAAKLYITISTVEQHLTRVYRKINISQRRDLPASLDFDVAHTA
ncbi:LuxR family transcriptional regulator [Streptomyces sp. Rer75]|uniref:helix-turn-helix transcriptional regulator n=1 Tax=Streptomyces sp. Rer75 TaxID=2750011 RepID=UPI0015D02785|nr:LuxR family transcriptional regulator [Streptomyces sp. Rer75]QLH21853.1 AAA family ATPase [Streptomyces sp. Rer75]